MMKEMATSQAETNAKLDEKLGYLRHPHPCGGQHHAYRVMDEGKHAAYSMSKAWFDTFCSPGLCATSSFLSFTTFDKVLLI